MEYTPLQPEIVRFSDTHADLSEMLRLRLAGPPVHSVFLLY